MLIGRFGIIVPVYGYSGEYGKEKDYPVSSGTFRTDNWAVCHAVDKCHPIVGGLTFSLLCTWSHS